VNSRVIHKLSVIQPEATLVDAYLKAIAEKYGVQWTPSAAPEFIDTMPTKFDELIVREARQTAVVVVCEGSLNVQT